MPPTRSFAEMQTEAEARSSAGGGGGGGGVPNWEVPMQRATNRGTQIVALMEQAKEGYLAMMEDKDVKLKHQQYKIAHQKTTIEKLEDKVKVLSGGLIAWHELEAVEAKDVKLKHQQDQIEHQKTTIEKLQANVKTMEAVNIQSLIEYQKSMEDCHAKYQKSMMDCRAHMDKSTLDCQEAASCIKHQHTTIEKLELKIFTLEQDLVRSKAMEFELEKEVQKFIYGGADVQNMYETCNMFVINCI